MRWTQSERYYSQWTKIKNMRLFKKLVDTNGNKKTAALKIGCTDRHINRLIKGYQDQGKSFFIHGNRGRQPAITLPADTRQLILDLYRTKYCDCNLTHYSELLTEKENIKVSVSAISSILRKEFVISPKANHSTKKAVKKELKALQSRLPIELRLASVSSIEEANEFLNSYIKKFNKQFAIPIDNIKSVFEIQPEHKYLLKTNIPKQHFPKYYIIFVLQLLHFQITLPYF